MANEMDPQSQRFFQFLEKFMQSSGAGDLMSFGGENQGPNLADPQAGINPMLAGQAVNRPGVFQKPVSGQLAPSYGPQGVIFGGGSPYPVDPGPARLQNTMVGLRDLLNSPLGQQAIAQLKKKFGGS